MLGRGDVAFGRPSAEASSPHTICGWFLCVYSLPMGAVVKCDCGGTIVGYDECWPSLFPRRLADWQVSTALELQPAGAYGAERECIFAPSSRPHGAKHGWRP